MAAFKNLATIFDLFVKLFFKEDVKRKCEILWYNITV